MATVKLPDLPKGKEFEEYIAAFLQEQGYYIERNIVDSQEEDILELDIISSEYGDKIPESKLFEVKSGSWGFGDIFKIRGWLDYLNMESGCLIVLEEDTGLDFFKKIAISLNLEVVAIYSLENAGECLKSYIASDKIHPLDITIWRFSYWTERKLIQLLKKKKKSEKGRKCYQVLDRYFSLINNRTFFTRNVIEQAERLYATFREFPNISAKLGHELVGEIFDKEYDAVPNEIYTEAYYQGKLNDLSISTFVEYRARLAIMKSAIDYTMFKRSGSGKYDETFVLKFGNRKIEYNLLDLLPQSFKEGLNDLSSHPFFHRYPVFWQWFLWVFGGFILNDYKDRDYELLSDRTGIPLSEIPHAIDSYQILFPRDGGWFIEPSNVNIKMLKLFPVPFLGIGANYRRLQYSSNHKWAGLQLTGSHTHDDLLKWNNVVVELLIKNL